MTISIEKAMGIAIEKTMRTPLILLLLFVPLAAPQAAEKALDRDTAELCMDVSVRARVQGLEDFVLATDERSGAGGARYTGSDLFEVESNAPVRLIVSGGNLQNGYDQLATQYFIDGQAGYIETGPGVHKDVHSLEANTVLGDISDQLAGEYSAQVSITVVPLISSTRSCRSVGSGVSNNQRSTEVKSDTTITIPQTIDGTTVEQTELEQLESSINSLSEQEKQLLLNFAQDVLDNGAD